MTAPWSSVEDAAERLSAVKDSVYSSIEQRLQAHKIGCPWKSKRTENWLSAGGAREVEKGRSRRK